MFNSLSPGKEDWRHMASHRHSELVYKVACDVVVEINWCMHKTSWYCREKCVLQLVCVPSVFPTSHSWNIQPCLFYMQELFLDRVVQLLHLVKKIFSLSGLAVRLTQVIFLSAFKRLSVNLHPSTSVCPTVFCVLICLLSLLSFLYNFSTDSKKLAYYGTKYERIWHVDL